jgi:alkylhydroperoxidase/carboxymuconolactone decarboxylase family protein YurZ
MLLSEKIQQYVQKLPPSFQAQVLDFVEYLEAKAERTAAQQEDREWSSLSLAFAMRGMEDEEMPTYTAADLRRGRTRGRHDWG